MIITEKEDYFFFKCQYWTVKSDIDANWAFYSVVKTAKVKHTLKTSVWIYLCGISKKCDNYLTNFRFGSQIFDRKIV